MQRLLLFSIACLIVWLPARSQEVDLVDCIKIALEHNLDIRESDLKAEQIRQTSRQARQAFLPNIEADAQYFQYLDNYPVYFFPEAEGNVLSNGSSTGSYPVQLGQRQNFSTGIGIRQPLFDFRVLKASEVIRETGRSAELQRKMTEDEVIYAIAKAYIELTILYRDQELIEAGLERLQQSQQILNSNLEAELASADDRDELEIRRIDLELNQQQVNNGIAMSEAYLKMLMGVPTDEPVALNPEVNIPLPADSSGDQYSVREELINKQLQLESMNREMKKFERYPRLDLFLRMRWLQQADNGLFSSSTDWYNLHMAGISLTVPILDGMTSRNEQELSAINIRQLELRRERVRKGEELARIRAAKDLEMAAKTIESARQIAEIRMNQRDRANLRYEKGIDALADLLKSEAEANRAILEMHKKELGYHLARLEYLKSTGSLNLLISGD